MTSDARTAGLPWLAALLALALSFAARFPAASLPIEGDAVAYGALARALARGDGYTIDGASHDRSPPAYPAVVSLAIRGGASVTDAVRRTSLALGALVAPLTVLLGARLVRGRLSPWLVAALASLHPALVLFAGGLVPGSEALAIDLVLGSFLLLSGSSRGVRALGLVLAALVPLARYDATPFAIAAIGLAVVRRPAGTSLPRVAAGTACAVLLPLLLWCLRNAAVSGSPLGHGYASHAFSIARVPQNLLVLAALVLPAAGLGLLSVFAPSGAKALWNVEGEPRALARAALLACLAHLLLVALFAGPTFGHDGSMSFSSGSLRFGLAIVPFVLVAAAAGLASRPAAWRTTVAVATLVPSLALSALLASGPLQRSLPMAPMEAARLDLLADAYRAAVAEARDSDWIAFDLAPRANAGVEIFLEDLGPSGHRVGVVKAPEIPRGLFPRPDVLPFAVELPADRRAVLVTDRPVPEGPIYTAGGQGIFHRVLLSSIGRPGRDAVVTIHQVRRTEK